MQAYDLIMLVILGMATLFGAIKGFAWQIASLASIVVSYIVAYRFRFDVAEMIQAKPPWNLFLAMLILFVGTSFVIWVAFRVFSGMIDKVRLKEFDRQLGALFGFAKGLIYCLLVTMFAMSLLGPNQQQAICQSNSGYYIAKTLDHGIGVLPSELHEVVGPYLAELDSKLRRKRTEGDMLEADDEDGWSGLENLPGVPNALVDSMPSLSLDDFAEPSTTGDGNWNPASAERFPNNAPGGGYSGDGTNRQPPATLPQDFPPLNSRPLSQPRDPSGHDSSSNNFGSQPGYFSGEGDSSSSARERSTQSGLRSFSPDGGGVYPGPYDGRSDATRQAESPWNNRFR